VGCHALAQTCPKTKPFPILALAANLTPDDREEAYNAGCDAFLTKPVAADVLLGRIRELLRPSTI
jgi:DNA-binding response OmpR family regulator